jgi:chromosome segregation ATPase
VGDKRIEALSAELVLMVETNNEQIEDIDRRIAELQQERQNVFLANFEKINQQRGRILERESMNADAAQTHENAPLSVLPGMQGAIHHEAQKEA